MTGEDGGERPDEWRQYAGLDRYLVGVDGPAVWRLTDRCQVLPDPDQFTGSIVAALIELVALGVVDAASRYVDRLFPEWDDSEQRHRHPILALVPALRERLRVEGVEGNQRCGDALQQRGALAFLPDAFRLRVQQRRDGRFRVSPCRRGLRDTRSIEEVGPVETLGSR